MKIKVDYDLCEANGVCTRYAPEVFEVDDDDNLQLLVEQPGEDLRAKVVKAVNRCPKGALEIVE